MKLAAKLSGEFSRGGKQGRRGAETLATRRPTPSRAAPPPPDQGKVQPVALPQLCRVSASEMKPPAEPDCLSAAPLERHTVPRRQPGSGSKSSSKQRQRQRDGSWFVVVFVHLYAIVPLSFFGPLSPVSPTTNAEPKSTSLTSMSSASASWSCLQAATVITPADKKTAAQAHAHAHAIFSRLSKGWGQ